MPNLSVEVSNRYRPLLSPGKSARLICRRLDDCGCFPIGGGELSIAFVGDEEIGRIHAEFMDDPSPTDVITFPADSEMDSAGEIIVSVDHARNRAAGFGHSFSEELSLYLIHGWLHLAGFDDRCAADRRAIRKAEQQALELIGQTKPAIEFRLRLEDS